MIYARKLCLWRSLWYLVKMMKVCTPANFFGISTYVKLKKRKGKHEVRHLSRHLAGLIPTHLLKIPSIFCHNRLCLITCPTCLKNPAAPSNAWFLPWRKRSSSFSHWSRLGDLLESNESILDPPKSPKSGFEDGGISLFAATMQQWLPYQSYMSVPEASRTWKGVYFLPASIRNQTPRVQGWMQSIFGYRLITFDNIIW